MRILRGYRNLRNLPPSIVTVGNFDGVHRGHQAIIDAVVQQGDANALVPTVVTFEPLPEEYFARTSGVPQMARLTTLRMKAKRLAELGVQQIVVLPFSSALATLDAEQFVSEILVRRLRARALVIGDDFRFGRDRKGDFGLLQSLQKQYGYALAATSSILLNGVRVSSSQIRHWLSEGNIEQANRALGWPWRFESRIVMGDKIGRSIGFPTANFRLGKIRPPLTGVYAVIGGRVGSDAVWQGVANVGTRPTVSGNVWRFEVHWFDVDEILYGQQLWVQPIARVREETKFASLSALKSQIAIDCQRARDMLADHKKWNHG